MATGMKERSRNRGYHLNYHIMENSSSSHYLVYLNGLFHGMDSWRKQYRYKFFQRNYNQVFLDYQGFGGSGRNQDKAPDFFDIVEDIRSVLANENIQKADFVAFSAGGMFAIGLLHKYPEIARRLVLVNTGLEVRNHSRALIKGVSGLLKNGSRPKDVHRLIYPWFYSPSYLEKLMDMEKGVLESFDAYHLDQEGIVNFLRLFLRIPDLAAFVKEIRTPTLVISSEEDYVFPLRQQEAISRLAPSSHHVVFPGCGHSSFIEQYREFNISVENFLKKGIAA